jgi:tRNA A-37 threonylcarbamoyl transferase component Bud32
VNPERFRRLMDLVGDTLERPDAERSAWLAEQCGDDAELLVEAGSLLLDASVTSLAGLTGRLRVPVFRAAARTIADEDRSRTGERVGAYRLVDELGHGGMGTVYLAERDDEQYRARVAIKFVRGRLAAPELEHRFRAERQILADLNHPNIARLLDGGTAVDGTPYLVMEYVEGEPIDAWCDARGLGVRARIELFLRVCDAVAYAHRSGVVHRDLKPSNILVTPDGVPKLVDFGVARLVGAAAESEQTVMLRVMTPTHASPEQVRGGAISFPTDVYSLGVVLYELLAGRTPFVLERASIGEIERLICTVRPVPPSEAAGGRDAAWRRELAGRPDEIALRSLEKEPDCRHDSVDALAQALRRFLDAPPRGRIAWLRYRARRLARRPAVLAAAGGVLMLCAAAGFFAWARTAARPAPLGEFEFLPVQEVAAEIPLPYQVRTADVNGDGHPDLVWNHLGAGSNQTRVALGTGDGMFAFQSSFTHPHAAVPLWDDTHELVIGDFTGDGAADLVWYAFAQREKRMYVALSNGDGSFRFLEPQREGPRWAGEWRAKAADADGDGRDDLIFSVLMKDNLTRVLLSQGDGTFAETYGLIHITQGWERYSTYLGDVDGDGGLDLIWNDVPGGMNRTYVARSLEKLEQLPWQDHPDAVAAEVAPELSRWAGFATHVGDVDGDGRTDIFWIAADRDPMAIHRALGGLTAQFRFLDAQEATRPPAAGRLATAVGDFNGDGRADLLLYGLDGETDRFWIGLGTRGGEFAFSPEAYQRTAAAGAGVERSAFAVDVLIVDVDGDGRSDIVWSDRSHANRVYVALSQPPVSRARLP